jgi:dTDP-4-amino-4,6-dideoxygalactose transaminase
MAELKEMGIGTQVHYIPLYRHPFFQEKYGSVVDRFPNTETFYSQELSFPLFNDLKKTEVKSICKALKSLLKSKEALASKR